MAGLAKQRILVSGVQGQVGFELIKSLSTSGAELILAARRPEALQSLGFRTVSLDLSQKDSIRSVIQEVKPSLVINPAAYTAVDKAESERDQAFAINHGALQTLCELLRPLRAGLIHFSTDYVYNPAHTLAIDEDGPKNPPNVYAASKLAGEEVVLSSDIPHLVLRTSWVYGINGNNFVKTMLRLGSERPQLSIVADQVGSPTSAVTLAQAVADILHRASNDPLAFLGEKRGAYNISDRGYTNWYEFAREIFQLGRSYGYDLKVEDVQPIKTSDYKTPAQRPLNSRMKLDKLRDELGIVPPTWQQSLALFLFQSKLKLQELRSH